MAGQANSDKVSSEGSEGDGAPQATAASPSNEKKGLGKTSQSSIPHAAAAATAAARLARPAYSRRLSQPGDGMQWGIPTNKEATVHVKDVRGQESLQYRALKVLHSTKIQVTLMLLLLMDVIIIFLEIFLIATYPPCDTIVRDAINCCESHGEGDLRFLAGGEDSHEHVCPDPALYPDFDTEAGCDDHKWHTVHTVEEVLFGITLTILTLFAIELNVEMWALGPCVFFKQFFFALDYFIITMSLVLEITFHLLSEQSFEAIVGLVLIVRVWRFVRIGHGIVEITHEVAHHEYTKLLTYTEELESILQNTYRHELPENHSIHRSTEDLLGEIEKARREKHRTKRYSSQESNKSSE